MPTSSLSAVPDVSDEELAIQGAFAELYSRYARRVLGFLANQNVPASDREDVNQETWLRVHHKLQEWSQKADSTAAMGQRTEHFRGWLFTIARNLACDWHRRRRAVPLDHEYDRADDRSQTPAERLEESEYRERFKHCLDQLDQIEAEFVKGRIEGEDYELLANRLGMPLKQAYRLFFELKSKLQRCTERSDHGPGNTRPT